MFLVYTHRITSLIEEEVWKTTWSLEACIEQTPEKNEEEDKHLCLSLLDEWVDRLFDGWSGFHKEKASVQRKEALKYQSNPQLEDIDENLRTR